jgi:two-component system, sensor histidine kinase
LRGVIVDFLSTDFWIWSAATAGLGCAVAALGWIKLKADQTRSLRRAAIKRIRQARRINHNHKQFLATISHDLRQPLQAAGMFGQVLSVQLANTPQAPIIERLIQSLDATSLLLTSLSTLADLELERVRPSLTKVKVGTIMQRLFDQMEGQICNKSLRFLLVPSDRMVITDPLLLERLLRNLLVNALNNTDSGGILLGCRYRPNQIGIQIVDTGTGIAPNQLQSLLGEGPGPSPGLGLKIVRRMAQLLDHPLEAKSRLGRGSSFTVWIKRG